MAQHKLYTEEQVKSMLGRARLHKQDDTEMFTNEHLLSEETPIELPSDKEIKSELRKIAVGDVMDENGEFIKSTIGVDDNIIWAIRGAKWMKEQILNK